MSYQSALLASDYADSVEERAKDAKKLGMAAMLGGFLLPMFLGPAFAALGGGASAAGGAAGAGTVAGAQAATTAGVEGILAGTSGANIGTLLADTGLHTALGTAGMGPSATVGSKIAGALARPFTKLAGALGPAMGPSAAKGLMTQVGSSLGASLMGEISGISDKEYAFGVNPSAQFTNPFSEMNITKGLETTGMWYERALDKQSKLDELASYKKYM